MDDVQPVVEVEPERTRAHVVIEVAVGRRDDTHVDTPADLLAADGLNLPGLQEPQDGTLHPQRHLTHFIHEERAAVGLFKQSRFVAKGAGKAAAAETKQL